MVRVPYLSKEDLPPEKRAIYDQMTSQRGRLPRPFAVLLHSPELTGKVAAIGEYLRYDSPALPAEVREIATLATAHHLDCGYVWGQHVRLAKEAGVREEAIKLIEDGAPPRRLLPKEGVFVQYTQELLGNRRVSDATHSAVEHLLGRQGVIDLVVTIGYYALLCYVSAALEVEPEEA
ncbi:MAG: carboxymuconolactone decarboxylase family protein [Dehalococcoidia bacterium]|nr:carboxymuconolactone decarboxylase family protein [Dehalococcoidia bacterium]